MLKGIPKGSGCRVCSRFMIRPYGNRKRSCKNVKKIGTPTNSQYWSCSDARQTDSLCGLSGRYQKKK